MALLIYLATHVIEWLHTGRVHLLMPAMVKEAEKKE